MKRHILIFACLLTIFCAAPVLAQLEKSDLSTEIIKLKLISIPSNIIENQGAADSLEAKPVIKEEQAFRKLIASVLSERGQLEFDGTGSFLIVTDTENRLKLANEFIKILDNSGLTFDEIVSGSGKTSGKIVTETIKTQNLFPLIGCYGFAGSPNGIYDPPIWANTQGTMLIDINSQMKLVGWNSEIRRQIEISGSENRVKLFKQLINLFDQPFLEKEFNNQKTMNSF